MSNPSDPKAENKRFWNDFVHPRYARDFQFEILDTLVAFKFYSIL